MRTTAKAFLSLSLVLSILAVTSYAQSGTADVSRAVPSGIAPALQKSHPDRPQTQWTAIANLPVVVGYNAGTFLDGYAYTFGGLNTGFVASAYKYNVSTNTWSQIASMPKPRGLPFVEAVSGKIYVLGGISSTSPWTTERAVLEYDPAANSYATKSDTPLPVFGGCSFVYQGRIWLLGGGSTSYQTSSNGILIYDPAQDKFTLSTTLLPNSLRASGCAVIGNTVYLIGGYRYASGAGQFFGDVYKGTINGDDITWSTLGQYPDGPVMRLSVGTDGSKVYCAGGYDTGTNSTGNPTQQTYSYDPVANSWTTLEPKPTGTYYATQMLTDGTSFYVMGGTGNGGAYINTCEAFNPGGSVTPKLVLGTTNIETWAQTGMPSTYTLKFSNGGGANLNWSMSADQNWIAFDRSAGNLDPLKAQAVVLTFDGSKMQLGDNSATLTVTSNDPNTPTMTVAVLVHLQNEAIGTTPKILVEEGTGTWCGYCPYGSDSLKALLDTYPAQTTAISYHGGSSTEPMQTAATSVWTSLVSLQGWPQASINRTLFDGEAYIAVSRSLWRTYAEKLMSASSPVSIDVKSVTYNRANGQINAEVEVFFHRGVRDPVRLNVAQLQSDINITQVFYPSTGGTTTIFPYYHNHVLRSIQPNAYGEVLGSGELIPSQTRMTKTFTWTSAVQADSIDHSSLVIFVHVSNGQTFGQVLQSEEFDMSAATGVEHPTAPSAFALAQNYPNPFNPATTITFAVPLRSNVRIAVTDALGRSVATLVDADVDAGMHRALFDARSLPSGTYFVTMRAGAFVSTRTMTLMK